MFNQNNFKMKKLIFFIALFTFGASASFADSYKLNNDKVDQVISEATEITLNLDASEVAPEFSGLEMNADDDLKTTMLIAWIVDWFVGGFGIHRYVLGTKGSMWAIYTFTCFGIFGIVPLVDWFVLLINGVILGEGEEYIDNESFFMWSN